MRNYFDILRVCPLFRDIAPQELTRVLECLDAKIYSFDKGEAVFNEGDPANDIGVEHHCQPWAKRTVWGIFCLCGNGGSSCNCDGCGSGGSYAD